MRIYRRVSICRRARSRLTRASSHPGRERAPARRPVRCVVTLHGRERQAEMVVVAVDGRGERRGTADELDRAFGVPRLVGQQPQAVQAFGVVRVLAQQALVEERGLDRIAALVEVRGPSRQAGIPGGRSCEREAARQGVDAPGRLGHGGRPVAGRLLAHQAHGRVPGAVRAAPQPAPVRRVGQEQVDGLRPWRRPGGRPRCRSTPPGRDGRSPPPCRRSPRDRARG